MSDEQLERVLRRAIRAELRVLGVAMVVAAIRTLLLKWELPPYRPTPK